MTKLYPTEASQIGGVVQRSADPLPVIGPPIAGDDWVTTGNCCTLEGHRSFILPIGGRMNGTERYALEYIKLDVNATPLIDVEAGKFASFHGDPLDALVLGQESVHPLTVVDARAIGVMRMRDEKGIDDKIISVSVHDPAFSDYKDHTQLPAHTLREIRRFFQDYKTLENKQVVVEDFMGPDEAVRVLEESLELYRKLRRGEIDRRKS